MEEFLMNNLISFQQEVALQVRRRTCVLCEVATPNTYVTSFTRVPEKQAEWVAILANGDEEFAEKLKGKLATGRKYLCLDHFEQQFLTPRKNGSGLELIRNSTPSPFIPLKRAKSETTGNDEELDPISMKILMDAVQLYLNETVTDAEETMDGQGPSTASN